MNLTVIKKLGEGHSVEELKKAENCIYNEEVLPFEIAGEDEGEQLTHAIAAIWILEDMKNRNIKLSDSIRNYTQKVRTSIS